MKSNCRSIIFILCLGGILLGGCNHRTGLEGTWVGCDIQKPLVDWTLTIVDNQFYLVREDLSMWYMGKFNLNNNCLLKKIDLKFNDTHIQIQNVTTRLGIYDIKCDNLTMITNKHGNPIRPSSFDEYDRAVVFNFVRS